MFEHLHKNQEVTKSQIIESNVVFNKSKNTTQNRNYFTNVVEQKNNKGDNDKLTNADILRIALSDSKNQSKLSITAPQSNFSLN